MLCQVGRALELKGQRGPALPEPCLPRACRGELVEGSIAEGIALSYVEGSAVKK
jgi:hypothetical protein